MTSQRNDERDNERGSNTGAEDFEGKPGASSNHEITPRHELLDSGKRNLVCL